MGPNVSEKYRDVSNHVADLGKDGKTASKQTTTTQMLRTLLSENKEFRELYTNFVLELQRSVQDNVEVRVQQLDDNYYSG